MKWMKKKLSNNFFKLNVLKTKESFPRRRQNDNPHPIPQEMGDNFLWEKGIKLLQGATSQTEKTKW